MLFGENILYLAYFDEADINLSKIKEINKKGLILVNQKPFISLVNIKNVFGSMSNEAKSFVANNEELNDLKICEILYVNSLPVRILIKGYLMFFKPKTITIVVSSFLEIQNILKKHNTKDDTIIQLRKYLNI